MFNLSWKIGRIAGIDLYLHPTLFLLLLYFGAAGLNLLMVTAVFGCVLLHELGHALAARRFGIATADITLYPIGGIARLVRMPKKPGPELAIALAGPAVNFAIAAGLGLGLILPALMGLNVSTGGARFEFVLQLLLANVFLGVFNLIPAFPMDGGRVLRAALGNWLGRLRATEVAAGIGRIFAIAFGVWSMRPEGSWMHVALAVFVYIAAGRELAQVRAEETWDGGPPDDGPNDGFRIAPPGYVWFYGGNGKWRLAPIAVTVDGRQRRINRP